MGAVETHGLFVTVTIYQQLQSVNDLFFFSTQRLQTICYLQEIIARSLHSYFSIFGGNDLDRKHIQHNRFWTRKSPLNFLYKYIWFVLQKINVTVGAFEPYSLLVPISLD